jgi:hypothetical protein
LGIHLKSSQESQIEWKKIFFSRSHMKILYFFEEIGTIQKQLSSSPFSFFFIIWSTLDIFPKNPWDILKWYTHKSVDPITIKKNKASRDYSSYIVFFFFLSDFQFLRQQSKHMAFQHQTLQRIEESVQKIVCI